MKAVVLKNGDMQISMTPQERAEVRAEYPKDALGSDKVMYEVFEELLCNTEYEWVAPEDCGALTSAPMIGVTDEHEQVIKCWAYMAYQVESLVEDLLNHGTAILTSGNDPDAPEIIFMDGSRLNVNVPTEAGWIENRNGMPDISHVKVHSSDYGVQISGISKSRGTEVRGGIQITHTAMDTICEVWAKHKAMQQRTRDAFTSETEIPVGDDQ